MYACKEYQFIKYVSSIAINVINLPHELYHFQCQQYWMIITIYSAQQKSGDTR